MDFTEHVMVSGIAIQGGTNENVTLYNLNRPDNAFNDFLIRYQYDLNSTSDDWRPYQDTRGNIVVSIS